MMTYGPSHGGENSWWLFVALDEAEQQVPNIEGLTSHSMVVVPAQHLLVLGRAEEGDVTRFI